MMAAINNSIVARAIKFGYANARVKAMKNSLLTQKEMDALVETKSVDEVFTILEKTNYRPDLVAAALRERTIADQIELALSRNFSQVLKKIIRVSPKEARQLILAVFEKYEVNNIKIILLAKHLGQSKEQFTPYITDVGVLSKGKINKAIDAKSVKDVVLELGGSDYGAVLSRALREYERDREPSVMLSELDEYYYQKLSLVRGNAYGSEGTITKLVRAQADAKNVSTILRAKKEKIPEEKALKAIVGHGFIPKEKLRQAASAKSVEEAAKLLERNFSLGKAIEEYKKTGSLIMLETAMESSVAKKGLKLLRTSVLSVGAIAGFLYLKEEEINNIRKIVRAKEFNVPQEQLQEMIVQVY